MIWQCQHKTCGNIPLKTLIYSYHRFCHKSVLCLGYHVEVVVGSLWPQQVITFTCYDLFVKQDWETSSSITVQRIESNLSCRGSEATRGTTASLANLAQRWDLPHYIRIHPSSKCINLTRVQPQGEQGIKGEKGMRGLRGQVVICLTQIYHLAALKCY